VSAAPGCGIPRDDKRFGAPGPERYADTVARKSSLLSTRVLLTCAAIGVAAGLVSAGLAYASFLISATVPLLYGAMIGVYFLPGVIAQSLLRMPLVALITNMLSALVGLAFAPHLAAAFLGTALLIGLLQELVFVIFRYRRWDTWLYYIPPIVGGLAFGLLVWTTFDAERFALVTQIIYISLFFLSPLGFTLIGRGVAAALARAGVSRGTTRRR